MRPLMRRGPDGVPYATPYEVPNPHRYTTAPDTSQAEGDTNDAQEPTAKGRRGRDPGLSDDDVRAIRADYAAGKWNQPDLAYIHGVTQSTIQAVIQRRGCYADVPDAPEPTEIAPREQD
jgi:hypothetical protein